mmetsp:Transcript_47/g.128  ORF Transcript_47/g.128 Transcript_47/m.128 type:complete len:264 (-) Transcript_47:19-810(-)
MCGKVLQASSRAPSIAQRKCFERTALSCPASRHCLGSLIRHDHTLHEHRAETADALLSLAVGDPPAHPLHHLKLDFNTPVCAQHLGGSSVQSKLSHERLDLSTRRPHWNRWSLCNTDCCLVKILGLWPRELRLGPLLELLLMLLLLCASIHLPILVSPARPVIVSPKHHLLVVPFLGWLHRGGSPHTASHRAGLPIMVRGGCRRRVWVRQLRSRRIREVGSTAPRSDSPVSRRRHGLLFLDVHKCVLHHDLQSHGWGSCRVCS